MSAPKMILGPQKQKLPKGLRARGPIIAGYIALVILVLGFGTWSVTTNISGAIIAPGRIEVEQSRQIVQHPQGGVVGAILVREGSDVKAGDILIKLDDRTKKSELAVIEGQYFELVARRGRLEAERDGLKKVVFDKALIAAAKKDPSLKKLMEGQSRLFEARLVSLQKETQQMGERRVQIAAQIDGLKAQFKAQTKQLELVKKDLINQKTLLSKGLAQASRVSALQREEARLEGTLGGIEASKAQTAGRMIEAEIGILRLTTARREQAITRLRDLQYRELDLSEKRIQLKQTLSRLEIRAPVSGSVYGMTVHAVRAVIRPAEPLMYIVPSDRKLIITSRIAVTSIDQVHVGQAVTMRFSAFDQRTTPELFGTVVKLSADAFVDTKGRSAYYRAEIRPNEHELGKLGNLKLLPGMPVASYIRTADRTPMNYLLKPVTDYFSKAFRG